jgi:hypothetical protein
MTLANFALQTLAKSLAPPGALSGFEAFTGIDPLEGLSFPVGEDRNDYSVLVGATGLFVASMVEGGGGGVVRRVLPGLVKAFGRGLRRMFVVEAMELAEVEFFELASSYGWEGGRGRAIRLRSAVEEIARGSTGRAKLQNILRYSEGLAEIHPDLAADPNYREFQTTLDFVIRLHLLP